MCRRAQTALSADPASAAEARRWAVGEITAMYGAVEELAATIELVVSELVANSVNAHARHLSLTLEGHRRSVRVAATDDAPGLPEPRQPIPACDTGGRGLIIIKALSSDWGVTPRPDQKSVWCEVPIPRGAEPTFACTLT